MTKQVKILFISGTLLLTIGLITNFTMNLRLDKEEVKKRMDVVNDTYEQFRQEAKTLNTTRDSLYENEFSNLYFETLNSTINPCLLKLQTYEQELDKVTILAEKLEKSCENIYFPEKEANTKCQVFATSYEEMMNYFINDIKQVNNYIEEYNTYNEENQTGVAPISKYNTTKQYIDFNKDKEYIGKEDF